MTRRARIAAVGLIVVATTLAAVVLAPWRATVVAEGAMALLLLGVLEALGLPAGSAGPGLSPSRTPCGIGASTDRPEGLVHLEAAPAWSSTSGRDFDRRARPVLRGSSATACSPATPWTSTSAPRLPQAARPELQALVRDGNEAADGGSGRPASRVTNEQLARLLDRIEDL